MELGSTPRPVSVPSVRVPSSALHPVQRSVVTAVPDSIAPTSAVPIVPPPISWLVLVLRPVMTPAISVPWTAVR